jgi:hypothetical protein
MSPTDTPIAVHLDRGLTIRRAEPRDRRGLTRLAGRDSRPGPKGEVLVAEVDGELVAARSLTDGLAIADPFRPTAAVASLLAELAESLLAEPRRLVIGPAVTRMKRRGRRGSSPRIAT